MPLIGRWWLGLCLLAVTGCFGKLRRDERVRAHTGNVQGTVAVQDWSGSPIIVAAGRLPEQQGQTLKIVRKTTLREPAAFGFVLEPGSYLFGAIEDANRNDKLDDGERAFVTSAIEVGDGEREVVQLTVREVFDREAFRAKYRVLDASLLAAGDVLALGDARFGPEHAGMGMWEPTKYALAQHPGVYMLAPYEAGKVPVLFVHGMVGYPREFESLIAGLDRKRFQPWVFMYPSGYPLATLASSLDVIVDGLAAKHGIERMCVVAHSMGGLVARRFLGEHVKRKAHAVRGFVTLDSPLHGMASAAMGTKFAPAVVPSWYDLDPHGPFITKLYEHALPDEIEYQLLFGFDDGGHSDGVVELTSQLRVEAQGEAEVVLGFRATHTGILKSKAAAAQVQAALRRCAGDEAAPRIAPRPPEPKVVEDPR
jgi:uncharacterized alpha/beta hydrolase family protein